MPARAPSEGEAVEHRHRGKGQPLDAREDLLAALRTALLRQQVAIAQLLDVRPGAEGLVACAGHDERARIAAPRLCECVGDLLEDREGERVEGLLAIEGEDDHLVAARELHRRVAHRPKTLLSGLRFSRKEAPSSWLSSVRR